MHVAYEKGLHELGDGLFAYLQPDGGWGWSNAGLITADGTSLLVDTLYDLRLTREMLDAMAAVIERNPLQAAMNTHSNPDHCFGNELLPSTTEIYASQSTANEMQMISPQMLHALKSAPDMPEDLRASSSRTRSVPSTSRGSPCGRRLRPSRAGSTCSSAIARFR